MYVRDISKKKGKRNYLYVEQQAADWREWRNNFHGNARIRNESQINVSKKFNVGLVKENDEMLEIFCVVNNKQVAKNVLNNKCDINQRWNTL